MVAAISKDGFLTRGVDSNVSAWTSAEDKEFFAKIKSEHSLYIMGRKTYESADILPQPGILRVVMTRFPEKYRDLAVTNQLEFTDMSANEIYKKYNDSYNSCLLLGGGEIYEDFLNNNLIREIYLTVEPINHKSGTRMLPSGKKLSDILVGVIPEISIMNTKGTKLLHYLIK